MHVKARNDWTDGEVLSVAGLVVDPDTNGGLVSDISAEQVAEIMPDTPALAVFEGERAVFVVALHPYDPAVPRGILHVSGTGEYPEAWKLVGAFLKAIPQVDILTFSDRPALVRLALRAGLDVMGEQGGYTILQRVPAR